MHICSNIYIGLYQPYINDYRPLSGKPGQCYYTVLWLPWLATQRPIQRPAVHVLHIISMKYISSMRAYMLPVIQMTVVTDHSRWVFLLVAVRLPNSISTSHHYNTSEKTTCSSNLYKIIKCNMKLRLVNVRVTETLALLPGLPPFPS